MIPKTNCICEACGASVNSGANACPYCHRSFMGVRCPRCHKEGSASDFSVGCPRCGYTADVTPVSPISSGSKEPSQNIWPASRYWILSGVLFLGTILTLYLWISA